MVYYVNYRFKFDSEQGTPVQIDILGPSQTDIKYRAVGRNTVLRREHTDNIYGTSFELLAECAVDGEYEVFKTAGPLDYKVEVYVQNALAWTGFVTPNVMEAPDIKTPYDVVITCTDGLGLLKDSLFQPAGDITLSEHLDNFFTLTGLSSLNFFQITDLRNSVLNPAQMTYNTHIDLDHMAGQTCYDVLQALLASLHWNLTQYHGRWLIFKETGMSVGSTSVTAYRNTTSSSLPVDHFGSMVDHQSGWWPVGHMTHSFVPAYKRLTLVSTNHYKEDLFDASAWTLIQGAVNAGSYWSLANVGDGLKQSLTFTNEISDKLLLTINVRNVGSGSASGKISVKVKATGRSYAANTTYYLSDGSMGRRHAYTDFKWSSTEQACLVEVQAPDESDTDADYIRIGIVLPVHHTSARNYFYLSALEVTVSNGDGTYGQYVYGITLSKYEKVAGYKKVVELSNGARAIASDVNLELAAISDHENAYAGAEELMHGVPTSSNYRKIDSWISATLSENDYLSFMARDYALSMGIARTRKRGVLNVPVGKSYIPVLFRDDSDDATPYLVETYEWRLFDDELSVEMISLPGTAITVSDEEVEEGVVENATNHSQAPVSTSGGVTPTPTPTGGVTSVDLSMPSQFLVSGGPITGAGTLVVQLRTDYTIPLSNVWQDVFDKAHSHSNYSTLASIGNQDLQHWDLAYQQAHQHNNLSVLDGITAAKVAQWDAASGAGPDDLGIPAPLVKITFGDGGSRYSSIRIWHPLLAADSEAEAVLMVRGRKTQSKQGNYHPESSNLHHIRKGWMVARTYTGDRTYTFARGSGSYSASERLNEVRQYIIRYYTKVSGRNRSQMASLTYAAWTTYSGANFGWERELNSQTRGRCRKMFGVAIRVPNPDFDRAASHQHNLTEHTQSLPDGNGYPVPRYIYSAVAPILAQITEQPSRIGGIALGLEVK